MLSSLCSFLTEPLQASLASGASRASGMDATFKMGPALGGGDAAGASERVSFESVSRPGFYLSADAEVREGLCEGHAGGLEGEINAACCGRVGGWVGGMRTLEH